MSSKTESNEGCNRCGTCENKNVTFLDETKTVFQCNKCGAVNTI